MTERLPHLVCPTDYYPLLLFHIGTSETAVSNLKNIKRDYRELGAAVNIKKRLYFCGLHSSNVCQPTPTSKHLKWLEGFASVPMPVLNACFCKSKRTDFFLDYEKVECNGQHSKINLFSSY